MDLRYVTWHSGGKFCPCSTGPLRPEQLQQNESYSHNLHRNWDWLSYLTPLEHFIDLKPRISEVWLFIALFFWWFRKNLCSIFLFCVISRNYLLHYFSIFSPLCTYESSESIYLVDLKVPWCSLHFKWRLFFHPKNNIYVLVSHLIQILTNLNNFARNESYSNTIIIIIHPWLVKQITSKPSSPTEIFW